MPIKINKILRCIVMKENAINWDAVPDVITKDQLYRICHISKSTALYLLQSGKIPCEYTGRKTRCYKIKKEDVIAYLENRHQQLVQSGAHPHPARLFNLAENP